MDELGVLAERFEAHRTHLRAVAYRMLGSRSEADDAVQEAWLRLSRSETSGVESLGGWLTTVVARVCLDTLRSRQSRREEPLDAHVPEPTVSAVRRPWPTPSRGVPEPHNRRSSMAPWDSGGLRAVSHVSHSATPSAFASSIW